MPKSILHAFFVYEIFTLICTFELSVTLIIKKYSLYDIREIHKINKNFYINTFTTIENRGGGSDSGLHFAHTPSVFVSVNEQLLQSR